MNPEKVQNIICIILYWYNFHWGFKKLLKVAAGKWNPGVSRTPYTAFAMHHRAEGRHRCRRHMAAMEMRLEGLFSLSLLWCPVVAHFCLSRTPEGCTGCSPRIPLLHCGSRRAKKKHVCVFYLTCLIHTGRLSSACKTLSKSREPSSSSAHCSHLTGRLLYLILFFVPLPQQRVGVGKTVHSFYTVILTKQAQPWINIWQFDIIIMDWFLPPQAWFKSNTQTGLMSALVYTHPCLFKKILKAPVIHTTSESFHSLFFFVLVWWLTDVVIQECRVQLRKQRHFLISCPCLVCLLIEWCEWKT